MGDGGWRLETAEKGASFVESDASVAAAIPKWIAVLK